MELDGVTFSGPPFEVEDGELLAAIPSNLRSLLEQINGFILHRGALHVRGVCRVPEWHSLRSVMLGSSALHRSYVVLQPSDVPFAQDCVADQYVLRKRKVHKLESETGSLTALNLTLPAFFEKAQANPTEFLRAEPLLRVQHESGPLRPGQVISAYPPFCTREAAQGVSLKAVPVADALAFLAHFSSSIQGLPEGERVRVAVRARDA